MHIGQLIIVKFLDISSYRTYFPLNLLYNSTSSVTLHAVQWKAAGLNLPRRKMKAIPSCKDHHPSMITELICKPWMNNKTLTNKLLPDTFHRQLPFVDIKSNTGRIRYDQITFCTYLSIRKTFLLKASFIVTGVNNVLNNSPEGDLDVYFHASSEKVKTTYPRVAKCVLQVCLFLIRALDNMQRN